MIRGVKFYAKFRKKLQGQRKVQEDTEQTKAKELCQNSGLFAQRMDRGRRTPCIRTQDARQRTVKTDRA